MLYPGAEKCGKLTVANISIPNAVRESMDININAFDFNEAKEILPKRKSRSNKGTYGKLFVMAGSKAMGLERRIYVQNQLTEQDADLFMPVCLMNVLAQFKVYFLKLWQNLL